MASFEVRIGSPTLDYFFVGGQSNAVGWSGFPNQAPAVPVGDGLEYVYSSRSFVQLDEPMQTNDQVDKGSAWSAFAVEWKAQTGRQPVIHSRARSGSAQIAATPTTAGHWGVGGAFYPAAVTEIDAALEDLEARPEPFVFRGVLWDQGGQEAIAIDLGSPGVSKQAYKDGFTAMIDRFRTEYGATLPFFIFRLGRERPADNAAWGEIRDAQDEVAAADPYAHVVFSRAVEFADDVPQKMGDTYHYTQAGYNEMGTTGAQNVAAAL